MSWTLSALLRGTATLPALGEEVGLQVGLGVALCHTYATSPQAL